MKKFIYKLILFSILPLLFILSFDLFLRNMNTLHTAKYDGLMKIKKDVEVIFLGNSHANYSINPYYFKNFNTYNLANVGQKIYFDKRLLKKAINDGVSNLKYVFISVDYHSLYKSTQGVRNVWTYYSNGIKYKEQDYTKEIISPFLWGYTPRVSFSHLKKAILRKIYSDDFSIDFDVEKGVDTKDSLINGFIGLSGQNKKAFNEKNYKLRAKVFTEDILKSERREVIKDLKSFIVFLKNNNIEPILFSSPTFNEYNKFLDSATIARNKNDINSICKEFDIQYWRYTEDMRFLKKDFYDQDHLNKKGAVKFSTILNLRLLDYKK